MENLQNKIEQAEARLKALKDKQKAREQRLRQQQQAQNRKDDTRRKILLGALYLERMKSDKEVEERMKLALDKYLTADRDRALFGLPPKAPQQGQNNPAGQNNPTNSDREQISYV